MLIPKVFAHIAQKYGPVPDAAKATMDKIDEGLSADKLLIGMSKSLDAPKLA